MPRLTEQDITSLENGPTATTFIAPFSDEVGMVGVVRNDDQSVAEALLVWIPGGDEASSNQLYRDAFDVLVRTVNPSLDAAARADLADELGLSSDAPPFPQGQTANAVAGTDRYNRLRALDVGVTRHGGDQRGRRPPPPLTGPPFGRALSGG